MLRKILFPSDVLNSVAARFRRVKVELWRAAIDEAREFRTVRPFDISAQVVYKFTSTTDFILTLQAFSVHTGDCTYKIYRGVDVVEATPFTVPVPAYNRNTTNRFRDFGSGKYVSAVTILGGGTITVTPPVVQFDGPQDAAVDYIRAKTSTASGQQISISGGSLDDRQLSAGDYYIVITPAAAATGHFELGWEEIAE